MIKKVLVVEEIRENPGGDITHIKIIEQSHITSGFGPAGKRYFKHGDFVLRSENSPERMPHNDRRAREYGCSDGLYVRGCNSGSSHHTGSMRVPSKEWLKKMRAAVNAYNKSNGGCEGCFERKCNSCKFKE